MSISSIVTSINSCLTDVDLLTHMTLRPTLKIKLGNLKTFLPCATKLGNDVHPCLGSLLARIEDVVGRIAMEIKHQIDASASEDWVIPIIDDIRSLEKEINEWYIAAVSDHTQELRSLTADDVVEITDSILENMENFVSRSAVGIIAEPMNALGVQMTFLKSLLYFAIETSVEHRRLEDLLIHFATVAINAAGLFLKAYWHGFSEEYQSKCSILIQKIKPIDLQVYQTYTQALCCSKLSSSPALDMDDDTMNVLKNFLDSLIDVVWDVLQLDSDRLVSVRYLQALHEGLRFLRTILKRQSKYFDKKSVIKLEFWYVTPES